MAELSRYLEANDAALRNDAEDVAAWLEPRIPVIYTEADYERSIGRIAKIKINENAKRPSFNNVLPEANHNEMVGFQRPYGIMGHEGPYGRFGLLHLRDPSGDNRVHHRFDAMCSVFKNEQFDHIELRTWSMPGATTLQKIFGALTFADWCAYTLALLDGVDPTPVDLVERFKKALKQA